MSLGNTRLLLTSCLLATLLASITGCAVYRHANYTLRFFDVRTGSPPDKRELEVIFVHEVFPLNAPRSIRTNLDENGITVLRLPDHSPTWLFLRGTGAESPYVFDVDLRAFQKDSHSSLSLSDKHTGKCQLLLTRDKSQ